MFAAFLSLNAAIYAQNNGNGSGLLNNHNALTHWKLNGNNANNTDWFGTLNEAHLIFKTSNFERLRITKEGNVGIGVEAPTEKLQIDGTLKLTKDIVFSAYESNVEKDRLLIIDKLGKTKPVAFGQLLTQMYEIDCFPMYALDESGNPVGNQLYPAPAWVSQPGVNDYGVLYTGMTCPARVGINTKNPLSTLHVSGSGYVSSNFGIGVTPSSSKLSIQASQNVKAISIFNSNNNKSVFNLYGDGRVEFTASQLDAKLLTVKSSFGDDVYAVYSNGNVWAKQVKVALNDPWGDYVFDKNYKLMSLNEMEEYIKQNNHLPDFPAASQIEKDGLDLGEIQRLQMVKIEEIMLYLIELKKENEELRNKLNEIQK